jgi:hypothetical protein
VFIENDMVFWIFFGCVVFLSKDKELHVKFEHRNRVQSKDSLPLSYGIVLSITLKVELLWCQCIYYILSTLSCLVVAHLYIGSTKNVDHIRYNVM